jgi:ABC-type transport system involved in multi-copper enzyme maturation permease subunit
MLHAAYETARQTFAHLLRNRLLWILLAVELVVLAIPWIMVSHGRNRMPADAVFPRLGYWIHVFMLAPWTAMFFGIQAAHGDIEDRTFQYLFLRPVPRWSLLFGKWLASALLSAAVIALGLCELWLAIVLMPFTWNAGTPDLGLLVTFLATAAISVMAYSAVAVLFGAWFRRPLIWCMFFVVGLEMFISNSPPEAGVRSLTVADPVRRLLLKWLDPPRDLVRDLWPSQHDWDPQKLGNPQGSLMLLTACCLALAVWIYTRSEYDSRERD